jgi:DNA-binding CsgD family transcriptional regulator
VKKVRLLPKLVSQEKELKVDESKLFVFCEKTTGIVQFHAESKVGSNLERTASLLAMQCLVRGQAPDDFMVLVPAEKSRVDHLISRAQELLDAGKTAVRPTSLSPRQQEVLHAVVCNRSNKEIASKLNISERTVKFHVSALLAKFAVDTRSELARRAAGILRAIAGREEKNIHGTPRAYESDSVADSMVMEDVVRTSQANRGRLNRRALSA